MADDDLLIRAALRDELSGPLERLRDEIRETGRETERAGAKANIGSRGFDKMAGGIGKMAKIAGKAALYGVAGLTIGLGAAAGAAAYVGITTAAAMETAKIGFTTMLGSAKEADKFLRQLADFAATTPFEFPELQDAASSLVSAGVATKDVIPIMRTLGDVTAGMGTGSEGIQRATVAIQQMNAAQKISAEDLGQLRDAGIPVYDLLSKALGKTKKEVSELVQKGKLGAPELKKLMQALTTGKGLEKFNGLMEKQSHTLTGVTSTLKDTVQMGLAKAFQPLIPIIIKYTLRLSDLAQRAMPMVETGLRKLIKFSRQLGSSFKLEGLDGVAKDLEQAWGVDVTGALDIARQVIDDLSTIVTQSLVPAVKDVTSVLPGWATPMGALNSLLGFMADHTTATHVALTALVAVLTVAKAVTLAMAAATVVKSAADAVSLVWLKAHTVGTKTHTAVSKAAAIGTGLWTAAQWLLNAALTANPIGLVIVAIALLVGAFVLAYKKIGWFRDGVNAVWGWIKKHWPLLLAILTGPIGLAVLFIIRHWDKVKRATQTFALTVADKILWMVEKVTHTLGLIPGKVGQPFRAAEDSVKAMRVKINAELAAINDKTIHIAIAPPSPAALAKIDRQLGGGAIGDTHTSRATGTGNLASTFAAHHAISSATGARPRVTNALVGGGGRGRGSGDHQNGRALDLVGNGLSAYAKATRAAGGYAAFHGSGSTRHLHAVHGDTTSSRARHVKARVVRSNDVAVAPVVIGAGAIVVQNPASHIDVKRAVADGIREYLRDEAERS